MSGFSHFTCYGVAFFNIIYKPLYFDASAKKTLFQALYPSLTAGYLCFFASISYFYALQHSNHPTQYIWNLIIMTAVNKSHSGPFLVSVGQPHPLGVSRQSSAVNFAIHARVEKLSLLIFDGPLSSGFTEIHLDPEKQRQKNIWYIALEGLPEKFAYAYRSGSQKKSAPSLSPLWLNDPYARIYSGGERWGRPKNPVKKRMITA